MGRLYGARRSAAAARRRPRRRRAGGGDVGHADPLPPLLVGQPEDGHLGDAVDGGQHVLDLGGVDVHPTADDEVVAPAGQVEVAVGIRRPRSPTVQAWPRQARRRGLRVAPVAEAGEVGQVAPDRPAPGRVVDEVVAGVVDRLGEEPAPGPGPAHRARMLEPVLGRADRELGLGRAVELPDAARADPLHDRPLDRLGTRGAGVGEEPERVEASRRVRGRGTGGGAGGGSAPGTPSSAAAAGGRSRARGGVEAAEDGERPARQQRARREADGDRVVHRRADQVQVVAVEVPHRTPRPRRRCGPWPRPRCPWSRPWAGPSCPRCSASGG